MLLSKTYATRWPARLGLLAMLVLLGLAWHFYLERVAYYDMAYHLFTYIQRPELFIQNRRFVAAATQLPAIWATRAGWSVDNLLRVYSVAFVAYYLAVYLLSAKWFKNEQVALVVPLLFVLIASRTFYWAQSEFPQALAALLLFYAGVARQTPLPWRLSTLALAALVPVIIFGHPLAIFPFLFVWAYDWLLNQRWRDWAYYALLVLGLVTYQYRTSLIPPGSYEATSNTFLPNLKQYFPHYLELSSFANFWHLCRTGFVALPLLLVVLTVYYLRQRNWLAWARLALVWGFVAGFTFLVNVSKPDYVEATYLENLYLPLGLFVAVPFALELLPALERSRGSRGPWLAAGVLGAVLLLRLGVLYRAHEPYTAYQHWLVRLMAYTKGFPERGYLMDDANADPTRLRAGWPWWASPYETMLLSTRTSPDSARAVYICNEWLRFVEANKTPGTFLSPFDVLPSYVLNANYFRLPNEHYLFRLLNTPPPADTAALGPYIAARRQTSLTLISFPKTLKANRWRTALVRISVPAGAQPLHSGTRTAHPTMLRSRFIEAGGWPVQVPAVEVPLEVDVWHPWQQDIPLNCPTKPGKYTLEITFFSKDYRDWPVSLRLPVTVD
ncbi:MAG: hypothetical protein ACRYFZ_13995 [Janthinobacterium lividum]